MTSNNLRNGTLNTSVVQLKFAINHSEKVPIHYRAGHGGKKQIIPASACAHDLATTNVNDSEDGRHSRASSSASPSKTQKVITSLPGDRVIFAESPSAPGIPVVYRTLEEKSSNPDRLNLDRRKLTVCPILEGEEQLRLLNYQHNFISKIQHLSCLRRLIFLDLYDNQIEEISGLSSLKSLRVLMLGKNRIKRIENLDNLLKLDVLDLHGNQIPEIEGLNHLTDLRVLNLAGNQITHVDNLTGMDSLAELNLRRNQIVTVVDVDNLPNLQRLFLSFNEISSFEDIICLGDSNSLSEISLDGNPIAQEQYYKQIVLRNMQQIKQLDMKRVTEEERRIALVMARKEEEKRREMNKITVMKEKRRLAINNAKRQWETMQGSSSNKTSQLVKMPEIYANHIGTVSNCDLKSPSPNGFRIDDGAELESVTSDKQGSRPGSSKSGLTENFSGMSLDKQKANAKKENKSAPLKETMIFPKSSESGSDLNNVADLEGDTLTFYGSGSLESLDKSWGVQAAGAVINIIFKFIDFDDISKHIHKIRTRFPGVQALTFSSTNIRSLQQINCLSNVRRLDNLTIDIQGNPVTKFTLWRLYTLFRLAHFSLKKINDMDVSPADIVNAEKLFGSISHVTTSQLPQSRLLLLLGDSTRRKQLFTLTDEKSKKNSELKLTDKSQGEFVGRAGLSYQSPETRHAKFQEQKERRHIAKSIVEEVKKEATFVDRKNNELHKFWSHLFHESVHSALMDFTEPNLYMKRCLEELEKG